MSEELKFHPLADIFPPMEGEEFDALVADIRTNGLREEIVLYNGMILDGRNRYRACLKAGWSLEAIANMAFHMDTLIDDPAAYVISTNIRRRHLTAEQKRDLLVELVKASPEKSDRQLAKEAGTTHPTIAKARKQAEATGKALPVEKRTGADGKARKQPRRGTRLERELNQIRELAAAPAMRAEALAMPTEEEAEESYQETLYDQACLILESMADATRQKFFAHLKGKYLNALGKPISPSYDPKWKRRTPLISINRLRVKPPKIADPLPQDIGNEHIKEWDALEPADEHVIDYYSVMEEAAFSNAPRPDVSAETMKAKIAALDDGLDIPESLRRGATA
jgi:ParB-like chromosome segregation protein Spo0J